MDPTLSQATGIPLPASQRPKPHRSLSTKSNLNHTGAGAEPGINPRHDSAFAEFGHIKQESQIEIIEYSSEKSTFHTYTNEEFVQTLRDKVKIARESCTSVRWVNIGGLSWDVISAVALKYDLHSLALEDVLQEQGHNHSKADYYPNHLFLRILCHSLASELDDVSETISTSALDAVPFSRSYSPETIINKEEVSKSSGVFNLLRQRPWVLAHKDVENSSLGTVSQHHVRQRLTGLTGFRTAARRRRIMKLQELKRGERVNITVAPMYIFLLRDGTVITIHPNPNLSFTEPITSRLHQPDSVLRTSSDASLLVESLLDLIVDRVLEVIDAYQDRIHELENEILLKPTMRTVRSLHILSGDLILHKRTLDPIKTVVYGLRHYDLDRCIALANMRSGRPSGHLGFDRQGYERILTPIPRHDADSIPDPTELGDMGYPHRTSYDIPRIGVYDEPVRRQVEGYMSYQAKIYLADVYDHMDFVLTSIDMFAGVTENLINYAFNMASYEMNEVMRRLTLATIIFLPLTLLTGYFGMNFDQMWSIHHTDLFFWIIALPVMGLLLPIFLYHDIAKMFHYFRKTLNGERLVRRNLQVHGTP